MFGTQDSSISTFRRRRPIASTGGGLRSTGMPAPQAQPSGYGPIQSQPSGYVGPFGAKETNPEPPPQNPLPPRPLLGGRRFRGTGGFMPPRNPIQNPIQEPPQIYDDPRQITLGNPNDAPPPVYSPDFNGPPSTVGETFGPNDYPVLYGDDERGLRGTGGLMTGLMNRPLSGRPY